MREHSRVESGCARLIAGALALAVFGAANVTEAADGDAERARALFDAGREDVQRGDMEGACDKFRRSHELAQEALGPLLNVADCDERAGKLATAWRRFRRAASIADDEAERKAYAERRAATLRPRVPHLTVLLLAQAPSATRVTHDGEAMTRAELGQELALDPGPHRFVVSAPGFPDRTYNLELREGQRERLTLSVGAPSSEGPDAQGSDGKASNDGVSTQAYAGWISTGVGAAGLVVGIASGVAVASHASSFDEHCDDEGACDDTGLAAASDGETFAIVSPIAFAVGVVGLAIGIPLLLTDSSDATDPSALGRAPSVGFAMTRDVGFVRVEGVF